MSGASRLITVRSAAAVISFVAATVYRKSSPRERMTTSVWRAGVTRARAREGGGVGEGGGWDGSGCGGVRRGRVARGDGAGGAGDKGHGGQERQQAGAAH